MAQEQVELEYRDEMQQLQQMQMQGTTEPSNGSTDSNASYANDSED